MKYPSKPRKNATYAELEDYRVRSITVAVENGDIQACYRIAYALGEMTTSGEIGAGVSRGGRTIHQFLAKGEGRQKHVKIIVREYTYGLLEVAELTVFLGNTPVVRIFADRGDMENFYTSFDKKDVSFFVYGKWVYRMRKFIEPMELVESGKAERDILGMRDELYKKLLVDKEV